MTARLKRRVGVRLLADPGAVLCPECRSGLIPVTKEKSRVVMKHGDGWLSSPGELVPPKPCPHSGKLFSMSPPSIEAIEI